MQDLENYKIYSQSGNRNKLCLLFRVLFRSVQSIGFDEKTLSFISFPELRPLQNHEVLLRVLLCQARDLRVSTTQNFKRVKTSTLATENFFLVFVFTGELYDVVDDEFRIAAKAARRSAQSEYGIRRILFLLFTQLGNFFEDLIERFDCLIDDALCVHRR